MVYSLTSLLPRRSTGDLRKLSTTSSKASAASTIRIPPEMSFDRVVNCGTCPPVNLRDFMEYLMYVEHCPENLQFYIWNREYVKRFNQLDFEERLAAPEWTVIQQEKALTKISEQKKKTEDKETPMITMLSNPFEEFDSVLPWDSQSIGTGQASSQQTNALSYRRQADDVFQTVGLKRPTTKQPFRAEIDRVIGTYIRDDAPRWLNLSDRERNALIAALAYTIHPSAFKEVTRTIENSLRRQSHPNFIRWSIGNGSSSRIRFSKFLGSTALGAGVLIPLLLTLSTANRGWRAIGAVGDIIGVAILWDALNGMCLVLHGFGRRQLRPWELFEKDDDQVELAGQNPESFFDDSTHEDSPWKDKWESSSALKKIFGREVLIEEPALLALQNTIAVQGLVIGTIIAAILSALFVALPPGNFFP